jgi:hypothetical protein
LRCFVSLIRRHRALGRPLLLEPNPFQRVHLQPPASPVRCYDGPSPPKHRAKSREITVDCGLAHWGVTRSFGTRCLLRLSMV